MDLELAKESDFNGPVIPGGLVFVVCLGLSSLRSSPKEKETIIAFIGVDNLKFHNPTRPGDTLYLKVKVIDKKETSKPDRGIIIERHKLLNQNEETVYTADHKIMVKKND